MNDTHDTGLYFNANWNKYQSAITNNTLYHQEMGEALNKFIKKEMTESFTMVDVGCGDCSAIIPILADKNIRSYIGIDSAPDVLKMAAANMNVVHCKKEFICGNMITAIESIPSSIDIIYTSYAVHHLSLNEKFNFIQNAQHKLKESGCLIMIDGVLDENQTRDDWLEELACRIKLTQRLTQDELENRMQHPRADDHPESIKTFEEFARAQKWKRFDVLVNKGIFALMVFVR